MTIVILILAIISLLLFLWQVSNIVSVLFGSPPIRSRKNIIITVFNSLEVKKDAIFYELGSGTGDVLIAAGKEGFNVTGFEISPFYYLYSKLRCLKYKRIDVYCQNIFGVDLKNADVIYVYLLPAMLKKLSPKFQKECKKSCRIISLGFKIPKLKLIKKIKVNKSPIYIYTI